MSETPGTLWVVATPLGNASDLTPRAKEILSRAALVLCEDTRRASRLFAQHGIAPSRFLSLFDHNEAGRVPQVLEHLGQGGEAALISDAGTPVLSDPGFLLVRACRSIGPVLRPGCIVVFESTVHPGATEEICGPELEKVSGLRCGVDFKLGYSPERINPGDREHPLEKIVKIVSGQDEESLEVIAGVYEKIIDAGVHRASSIKVAEAAKVLENTQRDINIALMNEMSKICDLVGIRTSEVLAAAGTKWNFLKF
ncbi:MAG: hypothetical protein J0626_08125, partial [Rhodospirillaceae bacterium]|nr:hypothetical protein [Rhodospirillaceae bacterium]